MVLRPYYHGCVVRLGELLIYSLKLVRPQQKGDDSLDLHQTKLLAEASVATTSKAEVSEGCLLLIALGTEAVWLEVIRVLEDRLQAGRDCG